MAANCDSELSTMMSGSAPGRVLDRLFAFSLECARRYSYVSLAAGWEIFPVPGIAEDAEHWHRRAAEARAEAERMQNPEAKRAMLEVAEAYERIALAAGSRTDR
jgi:hypothetical protein